MGLFDFFFGKKAKVKKTPRLTPEAMEYYKQAFQGGGIEQNPLFQQGTDFLQKIMGGDTSAFEGPLMQQFEQETLPGVAEQFAGLQSGAGSGLNQALARAAENLGTQLGAQRAGLMMQSLPQALGFAQAPGQEKLGLLGVEPYQNYMQEGTPGAFGQFAANIMPGIGRVATGGIASPLTRFLAGRTSRFLGV